MFLPFKLSSDGQDFFTSYDEVYESFDVCRRLRIFLKKKKYKKEVS